LEPINTEHCRTGSVIVRLQRYCPLYSKQYRDRNVLHYTDSSPALCGPVL
jgi:hypothetical protein